MKDQCRCGKSVMAPGTSIRLKCSFCEIDPSYLRAAAIDMIRGVVLESYKLRVFNNFEISKIINEYENTDLMKAVMSGADNSDVETRQT